MQKNEMKEVKTQKDSYYTIAFIWHRVKGRSLGKKKRRVLLGDSGWTERWFDSKGSTGGFWMPAKLCISFTVLVTGF